jgi:hypothetical protein
LLSAAAAAVAPAAAAAAGVSGDGCFALLVFVLLPGIFSIFSYVQGQSSVQKFSFW